MSVNTVNQSDGSLTRVAGNATDKVGNLSALTTTDKSSAVGAINEVNERVKANADAIAGIKNGTSIHSFGDVETALAGKANTSAIPTKTSQLTNDSKFITNSVNNLTNYYTKSNTYTKTEVDNKFNTVGSFTTVSGKYTTASWATGTNTCTWTAPATGTYIVWIYFWMEDVSKSAIYKQFQFNGNAKFSIGNALFFEPEGGKVTAAVISQPVTANAGQVITPYVHTGTAGVVFTVVISGMRIK